MCRITGPTSARSSLFNTCSKRRAALIVTAANTVILVTAAANPTVSTDLIRKSILARSIHDLSVINVAQHTVVTLLTKKIPRNMIKRKK